MSGCTSTVSPTTGSRLSSTAIAGTCSAWMMRRRAPKWRRSGIRRASGLRSSIAELEAGLMAIDINGMAHVILTVSQFDAARAFYGRLLPEFGMKIVHDGDKLFYCVGARTAIGIQPCDPALTGERFVQQRVGLHHLCLRARSREDVDRCAALLKEMDATIVRGPLVLRVIQRIQKRIGICDT